MLQKVLTLCVLGFVFFVHIDQAHAKKSFLEAMLAPWLDDLDTGPKPEETLQAPFADNPHKVRTDREAKPHTLVPVTQPHMDNPEVGKWLMTAAAEALSYKLGEAPEKEEHRKSYFTDNAWVQLTRYRTDAGFQKIIDGQNHNISTFVQSTPVLLNALEHQGRFRWLFEVPMMISVTEGEGFDYREKDAVNDEARIVVQVGRYLHEDSADGMLIESWSLRGSNTARR